MAVNNQTIMEKAFLEGTNDYQMRIGNPAQQSIAETVDHLFDPMNRHLYNQFQDFLVNRIGATYARGKAFENPLAAFKGEKLNYGSTIEEVAPAWVTAHSYEIENEAAFKTYLPEGKSWFYSQNRQEYYPITIDQAALKAAFVDEYGLNDYIAKIMQVPMNSDNYDEYRIMLQLIAEYENRWGFFKVQVSDFTASTSTDPEAEGKDFLRKVRTYVGKLKFPSTLYNCAELDNIPVFANPDELVLFVTPEVAATLSVEVLASIFHIDAADINVKQILVDEFPIPDAVALLTTQDFIVARDTLYQTESQYNPLTLGTSYFLHHWGIYAPNPFVPAILFTTDSSTAVSVLEQNIASASLTAYGSASSIAAGGQLQLIFALTGTAGDDIGPVPNAATYEVSASNSVTSGETTTVTPIQLNSRTYVDNMGVLHVQKSGWPSTGTNTLKIVATGTYADPSGLNASEPFSDDLSLTVS